MLSEVSVKHEKSSILAFDAFPNDSFVHNFAERTTVELPEGYA
jgi:hypothetical protein